MDLETTLSDLAADLLRYCTGASGDPAAGEDLAQEALMALVSHWRRKGPPESPRVFVYVVARRLVWRRQWRSRLFVPWSRMTDGRHPDPGPEVVTGWREELNSTLAAVSSLPERERQAILLVMDGNLDVRSAASVLGISRSAFKMRVHRARRKLVRRMESSYERER